MANRRWIRPTAMEGATEEEGRARCAMEEPQRDWAAARRSHDGGAVAGRNRCRERNGSDGDGEEELPQGSARAQRGRSCRRGVPVRSGGGAAGRGMAAAATVKRSCRGIHAGGASPPSISFLRVHSTTTRPHRGSRHRRHVWSPHGGGGRGHARSRR